MMTLYYSDILSARKACAAARYLQSPVSYVYLDLPKGDQQAPDYLALNPNGKVPTLVEVGRTTWEADAVICRLSQLAGAALWPQDPELQVEVIRWLGWNAQHFGRAGGALYFEHIVRPRLGMGAPHRPSVNEALADFRRYAAVLDHHLEGRAWVVGGELRKPSSRRRPDRCLI